MGGPAADSEKWLRWGSAAAKLSSMSSRAMDALGYKRARMFRRASCCSRANTAQLMRDAPSHIWNFSLVRPEGSTVQSLWGATGPHSVRFFSLPNAPRLSRHFDIISLAN